MNEKKKAELRNHLQPVTVLLDLLDMGAPLEPSDRAAARAGLDALLADLAASGDPVESPWPPTCDCTDPTFEVWENVGRGAPVDALPNDDGTYTAAIDMNLAETDDGDDDWHVYCGNCGKCHGALPEHVETIFG